MQLERRRRPRYPFSCDIEGGPLTRQTPEATAVVTGKVVDLSVTGAGVIGDRPLAQLTVIPWRLYLPSVPVAVPVLAQVRWVQPVASEGKSFRLGLTFLA